MRFGNLLLNDKIFKGLGVLDELMILVGMVNKIVILLVLVLIIVGYIWGWFFESGGDLSSIMMLMWVGIIGGLVMVLVMVFKK